jgi:hypothetical protein
MTDAKKPDPTQKFDTFRKGDYVQSVNGAFGQVLAVRTFKSGARIKVAWRNGHVGYMNPGNLVNWGKS